MKNIILVSLMLVTFTANAQTPSYMVPIVSILTAEQNSVPAPVVTGSCAYIRNGQVTVESCGDVPHFIPSTTMCAFIKNGQIEIRACDPDEVQQCSESYQNFYR